MVAPKAWRSAVETATPGKLLEEFGYGDVTLTSELHERQLRTAHEVLMALSDDSMLKPLRAMAGQPAPGEELGGWYLYKEDWDFRKRCRFGRRPGPGWPRCANAFEGPGRQ